MFLDYYRMDEQPFGVTPDPKYIYFSNTHREALASLSYGIETGAGFTALIAKPGMGKTTLLFRLLDHLQNTARTVFLFQTQCNSIDLLRYIVADLGLESSGKDPVEMHAKLNEVLLRESHAGRNVVVAIDEAQNLDRSVLETIRLLSDFETPRRKLLQIVLSGQQELADKLSRPDLAQLRQRITVLCRLTPFAAPETARYIDHRLQVAGYTGRRLFTPEAVELIANESQGIPRVINTLCFSALSIGCALGRYRIDSGIIREVLADLSVPALIEEMREVPAVASPMPILPAAALASSDVASTTGKEATPVPAATPVAVSTSLPAPATAPAPVAERTGASPGFTFPSTETRSAAIVAPRRALGRAKWLAGAGVLGALLIGLGMRFDFSGMKVRRASSEHSRATEPITSPATDRVPASTPVAQAETTFATPTALPSEDDVQKAVSNSRERPATTTDPLVHIVEPRETLGGISVKYLGRYDFGFLNDVQKLNSDVKNPNQILVGQKVLLPRAVADSAKKTAGERNARESTTPSKERQ
jgi:general secretion pathway protein A